MPDENTTDDIGVAGDGVVSFEGLRFLSMTDSVEEMATTISGFDEQGNACVVFREPGAVGVGLLAGVQIPAPVEGRLLARCSPMTDAIKRVSERRVVETVDREQFRVVDLPLVVPIGLAKRWASAVLDAIGGAPGGPEPASPGRRTTAAELLSQFVSIEPDLRVVGLDHLS